MRKLNISDIKVGDILYYCGSESQYGRRVKREPFEAKVTKRGNKFLTMDPVDVGVGYERKIDVNLDCLEHGFFLSKNHYVLYMRKSELAQKIVSHVDQYSFKQKALDFDVRDLETIVELLAKNETKA
ncbi:hypothetical protein POP12_161 [Pectobacterium phage POP12]|nr:hypothetical protein POP12_161 [Pectobacterium phage POP12]